MHRLVNFARNILAMIQLAFFVSAAHSAMYIHDEIVDHRIEGKSLCTNCDRELTTFLHYVEKFSGIADKTTPEVRAIEGAAGEDFVESRLGILIHKGCLEKGRWNFDIEEALVDGMVKGMSCLAKGEERYGENGKGRYTSTKHSIFPQFSNYLDPGRWSENVTPYTKKESGTVLYDSCRNVKTDPFFGSKMLDECLVIESFGNRPKIFCDVDLSYEQLEFKADDDKREQLAKGSAYASAGGNDPIIINFGGKTKIYNGPTISFIKDRTTNWSKAYFQSVLFHEMMHNLGYVHHGEAMDEDTIIHNDYAVFCQATCFQDAHPNLTATDSGRARQKCFDYEVDQDSYEFASKLRGKM